MPRRLGQGKSMSWGLWVSCQDIPNVSQLSIGDCRAANTGRSCPPESIDLRRLERLAQLP